MSMRTRILSTAAALAAAAAGGASSSSSRLPEPPGVAVRAAAIGELIGDDLADLRLGVVGTDGMLALRVAHAHGAATSRAPRLRAVLRPGPWPFVLKPLPPGCASSSLADGALVVQCTLPDLAPGTSAERTLGFSHKAPTGARLPVEARAIPRTPDPFPNDNVAAANIALWWRTLQ